MTDRVLPFLPPRMTPAIWAQTKAIGREAFGIVYPDDAPEQQQAAREAWMRRARHEAAIVAAMTEET